jgi:hypothetical protein
VVGSAHGVACPMCAAQQRAFSPSFALVDCTTRVDHFSAAISTGLGMLTVGPGRRGRSLLRAIWDYSLEIVAASHAMCYNATQLLREQQV